MSTFDFSPLFRSTVGFERMARLLESAARAQRTAAGFPPYNIEKRGEDAYFITLAVAGFAAEDLEVETRDGTLVVSGRESPTEATGDVLYRGLAGRAFRRTFELADHVRVEGARLENGLLHIDLVREVPEALRPRRIEIATSAPARIASKARKFVESVTGKAA